VNAASGSPEPGANVQRSIGIGRNQGPIGAIGAADAMLKAAHVILVGRECVGAGYVTVIVRGDINAVRTATEAGAAAARPRRRTCFARRDPEPHEQVEKILPGGSAVLANIK